MISQGGMSAVFRCVDLEINADCAIKLLSLEEILNQKGRERFEHECQMLTHFDHPNIIHNLDYGIYQDIPYLVMELCVDDHGRPLTLRELQMNSPDERIDMETLEKLLPQILHGMALFHQHGLVHRDVKPENVLLRRSEEGEFIPKVIDFGLVAVTGDEAMRERMQFSMPMDLQSTNSTRVVGTLNYMSPEQMSGQPVDARSDVYSLGLMVFRLLTGKTHPAESPGALTELDAPEWVKMLVQRATQDEPALRPMDANEMLDLLPEDIREYSPVDSSFDGDAPTVHQLRESANTIILKEPVDGRYQVLEVIGRNESCITYLCRDLETGQMRCLKRFATREPEESETVQRFMHECEFLTGISHQNIVRILDFGFDFEQPYVVTEYCSDNKDSANDLQELLEDSPDNRLDAATMNRLIPPIISAVADLHRHGLLHKDICPANVALSKNRDGKVVPKLRDFGGMVLTDANGQKKMPRYSASRTVRNKMDQDMALVGTYEYMSPEQRAGERPDSMSDVYSLGLLVYRAATGFERVGFQLPSEVNPELPPWVDDVCQASLEEAREGRVESAVAILDMLPEDLHSDQEEIVEPTRHESAGEPVPPIPEPEPPPEKPEPLPAIPKAHTVIDALPDLEPLPEEPEPVPMAESETTEEEIEALEALEADNEMGDETVETGVVLPLNANEEEKRPEIPRAKPVAPLPDEIVKTSTIAVKPENAAARTDTATVPAVKLRKKRRSRARRFWSRHKRYAPAMVVCLGVIIAAVVSYFFLEAVINDKLAKFFAMEDPTINPNMTDEARDETFHESMRRAREAVTEKEPEKARYFLRAARRAAEDDPKRVERVNELTDKVNSLKQPAEQVAQKKPQPPRQEPSPDKKNGNGNVSAVVLPVDTAQTPAKHDRRTVHKRQILELKPRRIRRLNMELQVVESGSYQIGMNKRPQDRQYWGPAHTVVISRPYWVSRHEVTQAQFRQVLGFNPSENENNRHPVDKVTWHEAVAFCEQLTLNERQNDAVPRGYVYRLPTEAEWEIACRAGSRATYCYGDDPEYLDEVAWTWDPTLKELAKTQPRHPVGTKTPNSWGFFDMHGNVHEWCLDAAQFNGTRVQAEAYGVGETDPLSVNGQHRIYRGGSIRTRREGLAAAAREAELPTAERDDIGFRIVLGPEMPVPGK